jgi:hypothetical protein
MTCKKCGGPVSNDRCKRCGPQSGVRQHWLALLNFSFGLLNISTALNDPVYLPASVYALIGAVSLFVSGFALATRIEIERTEREIRELSDDAREVLELLKARRRNNVD